MGERNVIKEHENRTPIVIRIILDREYVLINLII